MKAIFFEDNYPCILYRYLKTQYAHFYLVILPVILINKEALHLYGNSIQRQVFNERGKVQLQVQVLLMFCQCPLSPINSHQKMSQSTSCKFQKSICAEENKASIKQKKNYKMLMVSLQGVNHLLLGNMCGLTDQRDERDEFV